MLVFLLHRNPEYWANPDKFDPERFNPNNEQSYPTFTYLPFGEGPHFKRTTDTEIPLDLSIDFTISPKNGVKLSIASN